MNFYPHHISDFNNATRHLTRVERSVYRDLIELYYDTESALTSDFEKLSRRILANSDEEKSALKDVLSEFFSLTDDGYSHDRCDKEIAKYRANTSAKARAGIASAAKRKQKSTGVEHVLNTRNTDEQLTNNQEPLTNNHIKTTKHACACPHQDLVNIYHESMPDNPRCKILNKQRMAAIKARWDEAAALDCLPFGYKTTGEGLEAWRNFFDICNESIFLTGKSKPKEDGKPPFIADIDFLFSPAGFAKCLENKYHRGA